MMLRWTRRSQFDIAALHKYISQHSPQAADGQVHRIQTAAEMLPWFPLMGREGRVSGIREFLAPGTSYLLSYRTEKAAVAILPVQHGAQRWPVSFPNP